METKLEKLVQSMENGIVEFSYKKNDGTIRNARGTLMKDMCPPSNGGGRPLGEHLQLYYDVDRKGFRCFKKDCLIESES